MDTHCVTMAPLRLLLAFLALLAAPRELVLMVNAPDFERWVAILNDIHISDFKSTD